eukprot:TRINITY_DN639_c0_g2_i1.p1 TRINITY_DN639_c0_g2~~TRINITY_DN639_c0_g2_i1.p1  ORF type:complete len:246 (+),score=37.46 TRINITY_DN639_c0_g2_i1:83-820(+)
MAAPSQTLFIGDLPSELTEDRLKSVFGAYGNVTHAKMLNPSQHGKAAALLEFETQEEATWILENVNGNIPQGLTEPVVVKYKEASGKGGSGKAGTSQGGNRWEPYSNEGKNGGKQGGKGGGGVSTTAISVLVKGLYDSGALPGGTKWTNDDSTIFVSGLPEDTTDFDLYKIFAPFGAIAPRGVTAMMEKDTQICKGVGFVNYLEAKASSAAITTLNGTTLPNGRTLKVSVKQATGSGKGAGKSWS